MATVASEHMLSWLHLAFQMWVEVESYDDPASGVITEHLPPPVPADPRGTGVRERGGQIPLKIVAR